VSGRQCSGLGRQFQDLPFGDAADEELGQALGVEVLQRAAQRVHGERAVQARVEDTVHDVAACLADRQRLGQQIAVVVHLDAPLAQHAGKDVVLGLGLRYPQHVIEEQVGRVLGGEPLQFEPRPVQDHLP